MAVCGWARMCSVPHKCAKAFIKWSHAAAARRPTATRNAPTLNMPCAANVCVGTGAPPQEHDVT